MPRNGEPSAGLRWRDLTARLGAPCPAGLSRYRPPNVDGTFMASKRTASASTSSAQAEPMPSQAAAQAMPEWMAQATADGVKPEQALALIGLGLLQKMSGPGHEQPWVWSEADDGGTADLAALRQRLELIQIAINTAAPLSTAEVSHLMGARPGSAVVSRGGLTARRISRNVWTLSRTSEDSDRGFGGGFGGDGFRRRL